MTRVLLDQRCPLHSGKRLSGCPFAAFQKYSEFTIQHHLVYRREDLSYTDVRPLSQSNNDLERPSKKKDVVTEHLHIIINDESFSS